MRRNFFAALKEFMASAKGTRRTFVSLLLEQPESAAFMTIEDLAKAAGISAGMISRIIRELNFDGFAHFQKELRREVRKDVSPVARLKKPAAIQEELQDSFVKDQENLRNAALMNSEETLLKAATLAATAPSVHVLGFRSSYPLAFFIAHILEQMRDAVTLMDFSTGRLVEHLLAPQPNDLVIVVAYPRYLRSCILAAQEVKRAGSRLLAITDSLSSPLALCADVALVAPYEGTSYFNTLVGPFSVVNCFLAQTVKALGADNKERLERLTKAQDRWSLLIDSKDAWQLTLPED